MGARRGPGTIRRGLRVVGRHVRTWAHDPALREAAGHLAVLGLAGAAIYRAPYLNKLAINRWRKLAPPGTPGRKLLMEWVVGSRAARRAERTIPMMKAFNRGMRRRKGVSLATIRRVSL